ncbi:MAG: ornithine carbamoyltransferase, partial [Bryobacteraceae bacterium]|nr:ornithine carbamoyltransferase [Bryobacteraceae bacterium]
VATPPGYAPNPEVAVVATGLAAASGTSLMITCDPAEALRGSDAVYTDVWTSMGFEDQAEERRRVFQPYQVNRQLMELAPGAVFLHCLPAKRGEEVTDEVIESPRSLVFEQAENRLHTQKALLLMMLD